MAWLRTLRRKLFGGAPIYDGVGGGRRAVAWSVGNPGAVAALLTTQNELRAKSRDLVRRNAWDNPALESYVANAILLNLQSKLTTPRRLRSVVPGLLLAAALATTALAATAGALEPFAAEYRASYMGLSASGSMTLEAQGSERWKYSLKVTHPIAQLTQITLFEDAKGQWRPLSGSDISLPLTKEIHRNAVYDWAVGQARWSGDVKPERAGPVALQPGDVDGLLMNLVLVRDVAAGRPLRYRLVDEGRAKPMEFTVSGLETITIGGQPRQATKVVNVSGHREMLVWVVEGLPLPARLLQRKNGKDEIDLRITSVR